MKNLHFCNVQHLISPITDGCAPSVYTHMHIATISEQHLKAHTYANQHLSSERPGRQLFNMFFDFTLSSSSP
eukprot:6027028-Pleurochrysis_carterae.AAC.1